MLLAKNCKKKDNIKNGTLQLGTLHGYREQEDKAIEDRDEGKLQYKVTLDGEVTISSKNFTTLQGMEISNSVPGTVYTEYKYVHILSQDANSVTLKDSSFTVNREAHNAYILCTSLIDASSDNIEISQEYDDYWSVDTSKAELFGNTISALLVDRLVSEHRRGNFLIPKQTDIEDLGVQVIALPVRYEPREIHITRQNSSDLDDILLKLHLMSFIKPERFQPEKEFRFHFRITSNGRVIEPIKKPLILDATRLLKYVK